MIPPHFPDAGFPRNFQKPHFRDSELVPLQVEPHQDPENASAGEVQSSRRDPLVKAVGTFAVEKTEPEIEPIDSGDTEKSKAAAERVQDVTHVGWEFLEKVERSASRIDEAVDRRLVHVHQKIDKLFGFFFREEDGSPSHPYANNTAPLLHPKNYSDVAVDDLDVKTGNVATKPTPDTPESKPVAREKLATYFERTREGFGRAADFLRDDWQMPVVEYAEADEARTTDDEAPSETQPSQNIAQRGNAFLRKIGNDIKKSPRIMLPMAAFGKGPDGAILALGFRHTSSYWRERERSTNNSSEVQGI